MGVGSHFVVDFGGGLWRWALGRNWWWTLVVEWDLIFGGGLFAVIKAYGGKEFWIEYKIFIQILIWGFIYVSSIHLLMTVSALNDYPQLYIVILSLYVFNVFLLTRKIT